MVGGWVVVVVVGGCLPGREAGVGVVVVTEDHHRIRVSGRTMCSGGLR